MLLAGLGGVGMLAVVVVLVKDVGVDEAESAVGVIGHAEEEQYDILVPSQGAYFLE